MPMVDGRLFHVDMQELVERTGMVPEDILETSKLLGIRSEKRKMVSAAATAVNSYIC